MIYTKATINLLLQLAKGRETIFSDLGNVNAQRDTQRNHDSLVSQLILIGDGLIPLINNTMITPPFRLENRDSNLKN